MRKLALILLVSVLLLPALAAMPTVQLVYHVAAADGAFPATLVASATVTWTQVPDPAILGSPLLAAYDPSTGTATWTLPANSQVHIRCSATQVDATVALASAGPYVLNDLIPLTAPAVQPAWASLFEPVISGDGVKTDYWGGDKVFHPLPPTVSLSAPNVWSAPQEFDGGFVAGGVGTSDALPLDATVGAPSAYPLALTYTTGGNLYLAGGLGSVTVTIADYTLLTNSNLRIILNAGLPGLLDYTLTEGIQFSAATDNGTTASALASAINAWCPGVYAAASGAVVAIQKAAGTATIALSAASSGYALAQGPSGSGYLVGAWHSPGSLSLDGTTQAQPYPHHYAASELSLSVAGKTYLDVTVGTSYWAPTLSGGVTGQIVILSFEDAFCTFTDGGPTGAMNLDGNFTSTPGATLVLIYTGSQWREISRSLN